MKMGVREFRENFTTIAREAKETVIVTSHDKIVGWFVPATRPPPDVVRDVFAKLDAIRAKVEASGVDIDKRMKELGLDEWSPHEGDEPPRETPKRPKRPKRR